MMKTEKRIETEEVHTDPQLEGQGPKVVETGDTMLAPGKRRVSKKLADRAGEEGRLDSTNESGLPKIDPYIADFEKKKALICKIQESCSKFYDHEDSYNLPRGYHKHIVKYLEEQHYVNAFDFLVYLAKTWSLNPPVVLHGFHLLHRTLAICDLSCPPNCPKSRYNEEICARMNLFVYVCLVIAQKSFARKTRFTFTNILYWLGSNSQFTAEEFCKTELDILDGLKWSVTAPDINNYFEETVSSGIFNQKQKELFYSLIEIGMFYPKCQIFKQRDIAKSALYLVLSRSFRPEECAVFRELLGFDAPELRACSRTLVEMWQYTATHNLYLSMRH